MRRSLGSLVCAIAAFTVATAHAAPVGSLKKTACKSIGAPNQGVLVGGVHLETTSYIRIVGAYQPGDARWGVRELVEAIDHAAREVRKRFPDSVLGVGHLSRKDGGEIDRHHSHESGRDADLAFFLVDVAGRPVQRDRFYAILGNGIAAADSHVRFDDARNWALVSALVTDPKARVTHIFVVNHLRTRLLAYAARVGASPALRTRVAEVLMQPHNALPHDDHFHVRVGCPASSPDCVEWPVVASHPMKKSPSTLAKAKPPHTPKLPTKKLVRARSTGHAPMPAPIGPAHADSIDMGKPAAPEAADPADKPEDEAT